MADEKIPPQTAPDDAFGENLKKLGAAGQADDDAAEIAADDQGASAMAEKLGKLNEGGSPHR